MRTDLRSRRQSLNDRLMDLRHRIGSIEHELEAPHSHNIEEQAIEREGEEVLESLGRAGEAEVAAIEAALKRMDRGEYGVCVSCGADISAERLDALPFTPICKYCATNGS